jgi:threonine dehydratase
MFPTIHIREHSGDRSISHSEKQSPAHFSLDSVNSATPRVYRFARKTPLIHSPALSEFLGTEVRLKLENLQDSGSFKIRGASNMILKQVEQTAVSGLITVSSGNHGRAVAFVAKRLGLPALVCVTHMVPEVKLTAMKALGADVRITGKDQNEAEDEALRLAAKLGYLFVPPFDDLDIIAGQGTIGLEILEQWTEAETVVVPLSGGGLMGGIAATMKQHRPDVKMIGATCCHSAAMLESIKAGKPVFSEERPSLADALPGPIALDNKHSFRLCNAYVDAIVQVSEENIAEGMRFALHSEKQVLEGGAAIGIAGLLSGDIKEVENVVVVCTGNNVNVEKLIAL